MGTCIVHHKIHLALPLSLRLVSIRVLVSLALLPPNKTKAKNQIQTHGFLFTCRERINASNFVMATKPVPVPWFRQRGPSQSRGLGSKSHRRIRCPALPWGMAGNHGTCPIRARDGRPPMLFQGIPSHNLQLWWIFASSPAFPESRGRGSPENERRTFQAPPAALIDLWCPSSSCVYKRKRKECLT